MKRLYLVCLLVAAILIALTAYYRAEPDTFYGIADAKEIVVTSESAVEVRRVAVVQGQLVTQGDTLLTLHNPELELRISQISHELNELRSRKSAHATLSRSEILQLKAQQAERTSEIRAEIHELEAQYELNRQLVSELRSLSGDMPGAASADVRNPILVKLESLRKLLKLVQDPSRVYEQRLSNALSSDGDPLGEQVMRLEDELRILSGDRNRLVILAQIDGIIGSVDFKVGEKVSPFTPILTLHAASPSMVRGYIHEDMSSQVKVREKVEVRSNHNRRNQVDGEVVGVGTRIVEYPERLRKRADILIWGREIVVRLPPDNRFLLGEKVLISLPGKKGIPGARRPENAVTAAAGLPGSAPELAASLAPSASAAAAAGKEPIAISEISPPAAPAKASPSASSAPAKAVAASGPAQASPLAGAVDVAGIEASGLLFLPDLGRFLVVSDDNPKKQPLLHLMDTAGRIEKTLPIRGLDKMDDMEAISGETADGGALWVLSSQSRTRGGKLPEPRRLLVKFRRKGADLDLVGKVVLLDLLERLASRHPGKDWARFLKGGLAAGTHDIEGMSVEAGDLYLGFKAPLHGGKAVILRIAGADSLVAGREPAAEAISIWKSLDLKDARLGIACGIADLVFVAGDLWILSTGDAGGEEKHAGELWVLRKGTDRPERIRDFGGAKPEGLAHHAASGSFYVTFDNGGNRPSQLLRLGTVR